MPTDLKHLRELAEKATPGPWHPCDGSWDDDHDPDTCSGIYDAENHGIFSAFRDEREWGRNAKFIAAANPAVILQLLDRIEQLEADRGATALLIREQARMVTKIGSGLTEWAAGVIEETVGKPEASHAE